jgi:hypothetical protein
MIKYIFISLCLVTMASMSLHADESSVKISLGVRDTKLLTITNVTYPLSFRIQNTSKTAIKGDHLAAIFAKGTIHLLPKGGQEQHRPIGEEWILRYGLVPDDLQPGATTDCSAVGDVVTFFPSAKDGDYQVWWTLGDMKSNVSHYTVTNGKVFVK